MAVGISMSSPTCLHRPQGGEGSDTQPAVPWHWANHLQALAKGKQRDLQRY